MDLESSTPYRKPGVREAIEEEAAHEFYTHEPFEGPELEEFLNRQNLFYQGLGIRAEDLTPDETTQLSKFREYAGKRLLNAAVEGLSQASTEEILDALRKHMEKLSGISTHDLAHAMVAYAINSRAETEQSRRNSVVPEFLRSDASPAQAMTEELLALLWTAGYEGRPPFSAICAGKARLVIDGVFGSKERPEPAVAARIDAFLREINTSDFEKCVTLYAELVLGVVKKVNENELAESDLGEEARKTKSREIQEAYEQARQIFYEEISSASPGVQDKPHMTMRFFLSKARSIFDREPTDPKARLREFMDMGRPLLERLGSKTT